MINKAQKRTQTIFEEILQIETSHSPDDEEFLDVWELEPIFIHLNRIAEISVEIKREEFLCLIVKNIADIGIKAIEKEEYDLAIKTTHSLGNLGDSVVKIGFHEATEITIQALVALADKSINSSYDAEIVEYVVGELSDIAIQALENKGYFADAIIRDIQTISYSSISKRWANVTIADIASSLELIGIISIKSHQNEIAIKVITTLGNIGIKTIKEARDEGVYGVSVTSFALKNIEIHAIENRKREASKAAKDNLIKLLNESKKYNIRAIVDEIEKLME